MPQGGSGVVQYDAAGNLIKDTYSSGVNGTLQMTYDAENRMTKRCPWYGCDDVFVMAQYDGDGQRVFMYGDTYGSSFTYGLGGELLTESNGYQENGYLNGKLFITATNGGGVSRWLITDQLGTARMVVGKSGNLTGITRHDYLPFGEEIPSSIASRSTQGFSWPQSDSVRQQFTQKERDIETGLDYFGARYFASTQGRFTSPDPVTISVARVANPQLWNSYSYVSNNPLQYLDPDGLERIQLDESSAQIEEEIKKQKAARKTIENAKNLTRDERKAQLTENKAQLKTLETKLQGTRVVEAILATGTLGNMQLSDFELSTDPKNDFKGVFNAEGLEAAANSQAFVARAEDPIQLAAIGNRIVIPTNSKNSLNFYFMATSTDAVTRLDARYIGGGVFTHEDYHRTHPPGESEAYKKEAEYLEGVYPKFLNKTNWQTRIDIVRSQIKR